VILPLNLGDLSVLFAIIGITLLVTSEVLSSYRKSKVLLNTKQLMRAAIFFSILFLVTIALEIADIVWKIY
jgi:hypothetical protein